MNKQALGACKVCPALYGGYQLLRQQALAQGIANMKLFDYVVSGVAYDARNQALITSLRRAGIADIAGDWGRLFKTGVRYHCFTHQDLVTFMSQKPTKRSENWIKYIRGRYDYKE
ncbi:MAG: hypothetical protein HQ578_08745 [Chloroflexi bacterium]|nr:hypothetical protein [Chloroflexota bacterium]